MRYQRRTDVTAETAGDQVVLLDGAGTRLMTLNVVGTMVWARLAEPASAVDVSSSVGLEFSDVPAATIGADVEAFLAELVERELIEVCG